MKTTRLILCLAAALACLTAGAPRALSDADETPVGDYIRLHVVAHSDSAWDQGVKLAARDAVRDEAAALLAGCETAEEAWHVIGENLDGFAAAAQDALQAWGVPYDAAASAGVFDFPERRYGGLTVPAGRYRAVRIELGGGQGRNWWCVLFPTLCLPDGDDGTTPVVFYSSLGRWLSRLFGRGAA